MGKPSSRQSKGSNHSLATASKEKMNALLSSQKKEKRKRRRHTQTKKNIKKLFEQLRRDSQTSFTSDCTVIAIDCSTDTPIKKRKIVEADSNHTSKIRRISDTSCVIIDDNDCETEQCNITPIVTPSKSGSNIHCSTPISKKDSKVLQDLIVANISGSNNNSLSAQNFNEDVAALTREINADSYLTIDLTNDTANSTIRENKPSMPVMIDLGNQTDEDCTLVSVSEANLSISGESDITVLNMSHKNKKDKQMRKFARGIAKLDASEKGRLLELITNNIFSGCGVPKRKNSNLDVEANTDKDPQSSYIKDVIVGQVKSRNSIGSNIYNPARDDRNKTGLRMIVIDGSNVAMGHGGGRVFSVRGLKICIDYFLKRGHVVKAFVPRFRCKFGKSTEPRLLDDLEKNGFVVYTPSREIQGRLVTSYDDRYIVQCAAEFDGVIVSGDNYRDLLKENPRWQFVIENRLLPFTWVQDMIMFPRDPLGRNGPTLEQFLRHSPNSNTRTK